MQTKHISVLVDLTSIARLWQPEAPTLEINSRYCDLIDELKEVQKKEPETQMTIANYILAYLHTVDLSFDFYASTLGLILDVAAENGFIYDILPGELTKLWQRECEPVEDKRTKPNQAVMIADMFRIMNISPELGNTLERFIYYIAGENLAYTTQDLIFNRVYEGYGTESLQQKMVDFYLNNLENLWQAYQKEYFKGKIIYPDLLPETLEALKTDLERREFVYFISRKSYINFLEKLIKLIKQPQREIVLKGKSLESYHWLLKTFAKVIEVDTKKI